MNCSDNETESEEEELYELDNGSSSSPKEKSCLKQEGSLDF